MTYRWKDWDRALFADVAGRHWPGAEPVLPRLSHAANHGRLWFAVAAGMAVVEAGRAGGGPPCAGWGHWRSPP